MKMFWGCSEGFVGDQVVFDNFVRILDIYSIFLLIDEILFNKFYF